MREDARNSLYLWAGTLGLFGALWAALHFDWLGGIPAKWVWWAGAVMLVLNLATTAWELWQRRAFNPDNPNRT